MNGNAMRIVVVDASSSTAFMAAVKRAKRLIDAQLVARVEFYSADGRNLLQTSPSEFAR